MTSVSNQRVFTFLLPLLLVFQFFPSRSIAQYNVEAILESAKTDIKHNDFVNAIKKLNLCINTAPFNTELYYFRAVCKYSLVDNYGAEEDFSSALTTFTPYFYDAHHYRSQVRYRTGNFNGALEDINLVIEKQNKNPNLLIERAAIKLALNDFTNAITDCNKALQLNSFSEDVYLIKAAAEDGLSDYDNALCDYDQAIKINPKNEDSYVWRGITKFNRANYIEAILDYNTAISLDSTCTFAYYNRAESKIKLNETNSALQDYNIVLFYEPENAYAYFNRGVLYSNMQKNSNAIADFTSVLKINPDNIQALYNRAKLKQAQKEYKGAVSDYNKIIELYPFFMEAYYNRAQIKLQINDAKGAKKDMETGKMMSDVFHAKNTAQISRDSTLITNLLKLSADFNQTPKSELDSLPLQFQSLYYITEKDSGINNNYKNSYLLSKINGLENTTFVFSNQEQNLSNVNSNPSEKPGDLWTKAIRLTNSSNISNALEIVNKIIESDSNNALAYFQRAMIQCQEIALLDKFNNQSTIGSSSLIMERNKAKDRWIAVVRDFTKAVELDPSFTIAFYNRANIKCMIGDFAGALKDYENSIYIDASFAEAHFNTGFVLYYLNQKKNACEEFSKAGELGIPSSYTFLKKYCLSLAK